MKRLIGCTAALCLFALMVGCGGVTSTGTLAYVSNSAGTGFTVFTVNTDGTLAKSSISPQNTPAPPMVLQFSANGKWAYFLDRGGANIYGFTRSGNGELSTLIGNGGIPTNGQASSLVISPNSAFIYVSLPTTPQGAAQPGSLATYSIDSATGILAQVGSPANINYSISQLAISTSGTLLFGLAPSQQQVLTWTLNATSGVATGPSTLSVGIAPIYMVLSANGSYVYVLDHTGTSNNTTCGAAGLSPNIFGFNVQGSTLTAMAGSPFNENGDANHACPTNPIAGVTSNDNRYLFVANQGTQNISVFKINTITGATGTPGELNEILGSTTIVNGISTSAASPFPCGSGCTTPSFVTVAKANNALYVVDTNASKIFQFRIDQNTGKLRAQSPASVGAESASSQPTWITIR